MLSSGWLVRRVPSALSSRFCVSSEDFDNGGTDTLAGYDGLLIPGGFGIRGVEGMLNAIRYARESGMPFFGICLGLQTAIIEFSRDAAGMKGSHSVEFIKDAESPVICLMDSQKNVTDLGGTMRLGAYPARLRPGSRAHAIYGSGEISERHRHRYEFNNDYRQKLEEKGLVLSGMSPDGQLVEMVELPNHPYFVACQFHPEFKSQPLEPHPLFRDFVGAALKKAGNT